MKCTPLAQVFPINAQGTTLVQVMTLHQRVRLGLADKGKNT